MSYRRRNLDMSNNLFFVNSFARKCLKRKLNYKTVKSLNFKIFSWKHACGFYYDIGFSIEKTVNSLFWILTEFSWNDNLLQQTDWKSDNVKKGKSFKNFRISLRMLDRSSFRLKHFWNLNSICTGKIIEEIFEYHLECGIGVVFVWNISEIWFPYVQAKS